MNGKKTPMQCCGVDKFGDLPALFVQGLDNGAADCDIVELLIDYGMNTLSMRNWQKGSMLRQ